MDLISTYHTTHKEGDTTQTRFTDDLWTSVYNTDGECAYDTNNIHRSSVDDMSMYIRPIRKGRRTKTKEFTTKLQYPKKKWMFLRPYHRG